jgi:hypothetical protein
MTSRRRGVAAYLLVELLVVVALGLMLSDLAVRLLVETLHLERAAAAHANRMAVVDGLMRELRRDASAAVSHSGETWSLQASPAPTAATASGELEAPASPGSLAVTLETVGSDGRHQVVYRIAAKQVVRIEDGVDTHAWEARRLAFSARLERGPRAAVLWLDFTEQPGEWAARRTPKAFSCPLVLASEMEAQARTTRGLPAVDQAREVVP